MKKKKKTFVYFILSYRDLARFGFGEQTEHESSEQLLNELFDGVRAPWKLWR